MSYTGVHFYLQLSIGKYLKNFLKVGYLHLKKKEKKIQAH